MHKATNLTYVGLVDDYCGGMTPTGTVIRDAYVFGLLPETETCKGWSYGQLETLYDKVSAAWAPYGNLVSNLPPDLRARHERIFNAAIAHAKSLGWSPNLDDET